jgi:hypothetical protein
MESETNTNLDTNLDNNIDTNNVELPNKIIESLYLGSYSHAYEKAGLKKIGIKYILVIGDGLEKLHPKVTH